MHTGMMQYEKNPPLLETDLHADPLAQLQAWLAAAGSAGQIEPTAMNLATTDASGRPSSRMVLLKGFHQGGLCFYTNFEGRKGRELEANPQAAACFWWDRLERQVRIEGVARRLPRERSETYFRSRPRGSQIGALVSRQSRVVADRTTLDARFDRIAQELGNDPVPLPDFWGGYVLEPRGFEFWQGRRGRLHDRLCYVRDDHGWRIERLEP